jgi:hypothetical protein
MVQAMMGPFLTGQVPLAGYVANSAYSTMRSAST